MVQFAVIEVVKKLRELAAQLENSTVQYLTVDAALRRYIKARRERQSLGVDLFADPAWDILLDLLASELQGKTVCVSSACIAANVPPTTALRWIAILERQGAIERTRDRVDRRRSYLRLSVDMRGRVFRWAERHLT